MLLAAFNFINDFHFFIYFSSTDMSLNNFAEAVTKVDENHIWKSVFINKNLPDIHNILPLFFSWKF